MSREEVIAELVAALPAASDSTLEYLYNDADLQLTCDSIVRNGEGWFRGVVDR